MNAMLQVYTFKISVGKKWRLQWEVRPRENPVRRLISRPRKAEYFPEANSTS